MHRGTGGAAQVRLRRYGPDLQPLGPETVAVEGGLAPGLAALSDGGFVLTSVTEVVSPAGVEMRGNLQLFGSDGAVRGAASTYASGFASVAGRPAALPGGRFVVATDSRVGARGTDIGSLQVFAGDGTPLGDATPVNADTADALTHVSGTVAAAAGSGFAATWAVSAADGTGSILLRLYGGDGRPVGAPITVASGAQMRFPALAALADGSLAVAWTTLDAAGTGTGTAPTLWLARYDTSGTELGRQSVPIGAADRPFPSRLAALDDGGFVLTWALTTDTGPGTTNRRSVTAQRFDRSGTALGDPATIAQTEFPPEALNAADAPAVTGAGDGRYLLLYGSYSAAGDWDVQGALR